MSAPSPWEKQIGNALAYVLAACVLAIVIVGTIKIIALMLS